MKKQEANKQAPLLPKKTNKQKSAKSHTDTHTHTHVYLNKHREKFGSI